MGLLKELFSNFTKVPLISAYLQHWKISWKTADREDEVAGKKLGWGIICIGTPFIKVVD
jgi:hypothetical protein